MPSPTALSILLFGLTSLLAGLTTLLSPTHSLSSFSLPPSALPAVMGNGLAATAMGLYYVLAAYQENRAFFVLSVPMRLVTTVVFARFGGAWGVAAVWEGVGAVVTGGCVGWEMWAAKREVEGKQAERGEKGR